MSTVQLYPGDCLEVLPTFAENSFDTCITDPPYHLKSIVKRFGKQASSMFVDKQVERVQRGDSGGASRFFYVAKASRSERNAGLDGMPEKEIPYKDYRPNVEDSKSYVTHYPDGEPRPMNKPINNHPTVKPLALMRYLCKLTATPTGGIVLDPFMGSGTTGCAAVMEGRDFVGIEKEAEYKLLADKRITHAQLQTRML